MRTPESVIDSEEGLARIRAGEPAIIRLVIRTYLDQLFRAARGAGLNRQEAEDTVQETLLTFVEKAPLFEGRSKVRTFLFGILYRKIHEMRRERKRSLEQDDIDEVFESRFDASGSWTRPPAPVDERLFAEQVRGYLDECMEGLPDQQRQVFVLKDVEEMATEEVRNVMDVTDTNMRVLLHRARNRMRECLEAHGIEGRQG